MSVKVAVRVRPFNERELEKGANICINMQGPSTVITDPSTGKDRTFTFDYSFWSHDEYTEGENGLLIADEGGRYADQQSVYNKLGTEVLDNAWDGYHCCLFAYGQTGSGKSYSMIGYGPNKGIVPIATTEIFERIKRTTTETKWYEVSVSMLEIYNEKVQDLIVHPENRPGKGLSIRESKLLGVYVQDLSKHPVDSYQAIEKITDEGNRNRSIGSTEMNKTSSRAHTIITLSFKQFEIIDGKTTERFSNINLVDLAGSERQKKTKATKERLKEGCNINLSLTILGQVINVLAEKSMGKKGLVVPYRDSALTRILQNALGGNSKTIMICAVSPAGINYDESLNTLKYAERAKKVKNVAVVNESAQDKMIRELKNENDELRKLLMAAAQGGSFDMSDPAFLAKFGGLGLESFAGKQKTAEDIKEQIEDNEKEMKDISIPWQEKLDQEKQKEDTREVKDMTVPHITNLNEDPQLSGMLYYQMSSCPIQVGRKNGNPKPNILVGGIGILPNHAIFEKEEFDSDGNVIVQPSPEEKEKATNIDSVKEEKEGEDEEKKDIPEAEGESAEETKFSKDPPAKLANYYLRPCAPEACEAIYYNGEELPKEGICLKHNDSIIFGNNTIFIFKYPELHRKNVEDKLRQEQVKLWEGQEVTQEQRDAFDKELKTKVDESISSEKVVDWELAQGEKMEKADKVKKEEQEKIVKMKQEIEEERRVSDEQVKKRQEEYESRMKQLESKMAAAEEEQRQQYEKELQEAEKLMIEKIENMEKERIEREKHQQKELEEQEKLLKERQKENDSLETKLSQLIPLINEANLCAREFDKDVIFKTKLISVIPEDINKSPIEMLKSRKAEIFIKVNNKDKGDVYLWDMEKFMDRLYVIRELVNNYFDTNQVPEMEGGDDPFWDPPQPQLIGQGYYKLEPLAYLIDNPHTVSLIGSDQKGLVGKLEVNILPTDESGWDEPPEDLIPYQPEDLIGKRIDFAIIIEKAMDLPDNFCKDVYCEYSFFLEDQVFTTPVIPQKHRSPIFDYRYHHNLMVTENTIKYLRNNAICFKVFGYPDNEHKPFYEQTSGNESTLQTSKDISQESFNKDQSSNNISGEAPESHKDETMQKAAAKDYSKANEGEEEDAEEATDKFDDMFIYGAQNDPDDPMAQGYSRDRMFAQSVYQKPKELIPQEEQQKYIDAQSKDDINLDARGSSGKKKRKKAKGNLKDKKDCVIF